MRARQENGKIAVVADGREKLVDLKTARRLRDDLSAAISIVEEMYGFKDGVHIGTD